MLKTKYMQPLLHSLQLGQSGDDVGLNAALVLAAQDHEVAIVAPVGGPRVRREPVVSVVEGAVADELEKNSGRSTKSLRRTNLYGVATKELSSGVLIDTALVAEEVLIDGEGGLDGTESAQ